MPKAVHSYDSCPLGLVDVEILERKRVAFRPPKTAYTCRIRCPKGSECPHFREGFGTATMTVYREGPIADPRVVKREIVTTTARACAKEQEQ